MDLITNFRIRRLRRIKYTEYMSAQSNPHDFHDATAEPSVRRNLAPESVNVYSRDNDLR